MKQEQNGQEESLTFTKTQAYLILGSIVAIAILSFSLGHLISSTSNLDEQEVVENIDDEDLSGEPDDSLDELDAELNEINALITNQDEADDESREASVSKKELFEDSPMPDAKEEEEDNVFVNPAEPVLLKRFSRRTKNLSKTFYKNVTPRKRIVRVAVVATKREKLKELKVNSSLLPPAIPEIDLKSSVPSIEKKATPKSRAKSSSIPADSRFTVQVKTFPTSDDAKDLESSLKKKGYASYIQKVARGRSNFYRVRVGGYRSRADADDAAREIRNVEGLTSARSDKYKKP